MQIDDLIAQSYALAKAKGWWEPEKSFGELIALVHSELSEALEEYRTNPHPALLYEIGGKPEGIPAELADVIIRICDMCGHFDINLSLAIERKMKYNATRPYRHGGKAL